MLEDLSALPGDVPPHDPFGRLLADGRDCLVDLLRADRAAKTPESPERNQARLFLDRVQAQVETWLRFDGPLVLFRWKDPRMDQLYGRLGGPFGNTYLDLFAEGSAPARRPEAVLRLEFRFRIAGKAPRATASALADADPARWPLLLGLPPEQVEILDSGPAVRHAVILTGDLDELVPAVAGLFCRFLLTFRGLTVARPAAVREVQEPPNAAG